MYQIMGSECQKEPSCPEGSVIPTGECQQLDGQRCGKATGTNTKAVLYTGTNWYRLGMRSKPPSPGALYQYNTTQPLAQRDSAESVHLCTDLSPAFGPAHMDWSAQEKHRMNSAIHSQHQAELCCRNQQRPPQQQLRCEQLFFPPV